MKLGLIFTLLPALALGSEVIITFTPQGNVTDKVALWSARACPPRAVNITMICALATHRGVAYMEPATAERLLNRKSWQGRVVRITGYAVAAMEFLLLSKTVSAKPEIQLAVGAAAGFINVLVPLVKKDAPRVDPAVGRSLMLDTDGCGISWFYAYPSTVPGFNEVLP